MNNDERLSTIELILTAAIGDYAKKTGKPIAEIRNEIIESGAYDDLYDEETGLWIQGPDYFIDYFLKLQNRCQKF